MADPERFDAEPDPTFYADADPDPIFLDREREKMSSKSSNLLCVIFLVTIIYLTKKTLDPAK